MGCFQALSLSMAAARMKNYSDACELFCARESRAMRTSAAAIFGTGTNRPRLSVWNREKTMRLSLRAITLSASLLWGCAMLLIGLIHMAVPSYGGEFLRMMSSVYPGADTTATLGRVLLGAVYGFVDGALAGFFLGWLYDVFAPPTAAR
jgi:hypothetical protein